MRDFDDNEYPLAYLITFRSYGTWLHGDSRGSMDRTNNVYGTPKIVTNSRLERSDLRQITGRPFLLDARRRDIVKKAIREVCQHRGYVLRAVNVRTNHAHSIVSAMSKPEPIINAFKSYATRALRQAALLSSQTRPWARHGSTIYLWKERDVGKAMEYVLLGQGEDLFSLDYD